MPEQEHFHVSKAIDIGNILVMITLVVSAFWFINKFDNRITVLETNQRNIVAQQRRDREATRNLLSELRADVKYIRKRVDARSK